MNTRAYQLSLLFFMLTSCGSSSNIMGLLTPDVHRESFVNELSQARAFFDRNDLDEALVHATRAYEMNRSSEDAALLFGYINLSLAGADPFLMAKRMGSSDSNSSSSSLVQADDSTGDTLTNLQSVIGLTESQILQLGVLDVVDPDLPILIPKCAEDARVTLDKLGYVDDAINAICPFVYGHVTNQKDERQLCYETEGFRKYLIRRIFSGHLLISLKLWPSILC